jgi:UDP-glucose:(heptosyl)LPS alpha-1,3-glucosyltransferase
MKIAVVIPKYGLIGGAESFAYELTERLAMRERFEIHLFANQWRQGNAPLIFHKVPLFVFPRFMRQISFAYFSNRQIGRSHFDLLHSHDRIFRMHLLTMHGIPHKRWIRVTRNKRLSLFDRSMAWVERRGLKGPHIPMVLPVSTLVRNELLSVYDIPESKMHVIHPGVSLERFSSLDRKNCRLRVRSRYGLSESDIVILFVGMNFEIKRLKLVIEGVAEFIREDKRGARLKVLVVGKGATTPYQTLARRLGIADRVIFAGVTRQVEKYYLASDLFAMPSRFDTFGMAVLEAMAAGLPVIITEKVGAKDLVTDGVQGFVLGEEPSPSDFGGKISSLLINDNRLKMGEMAHKKALAHDWDRVADQMEDIYLMQQGLDYRIED